MASQLLRYEGGRTGVNSPYILYALIGILLVASVILSILYGRRQRHEYDDDVAETTVKHKIMGNPIVIALLLCFAIILAFSLLSFIY